ncbi:MAG: hypothetical protein DRR16_13060 [Candidatus Parabeggiatoa sp. nov. 3]|nr:MAG: hypothetical protein DRR00_19180 [Gammaproteobacteria bacterium]RKZ64408.1 MAG: hypothetical protein DRQ99_15545 [Gammaproteobacteria bacterium]RKZ85055.1 MAG: hypothetical protein DRR16_13060 [Gammaproteobacteria bacterium]
MQHAWSAKFILQHAWSAKFILLLLQIDNGFLGMRPLDLASLVTACSKALPERLNMYVTGNFYIYNTRFVLYVFDRNPCPGVLNINTFLGLFFTLFLFGKG